MCSDVSSGSLPVTALLHLKLLSILALTTSSTYIILSQKQERSWFSLIPSISSKYSLPDPLLTLQSPKIKESWKKLTKAKVTDFWEGKLRTQVFIPLIP